MACPNHHHQMVLLPCCHQLPPSEMLRLILEDTMLLSLLNLLHSVYYSILLFPHLLFPFSDLFSLYNYCHGLGALITPSVGCSGRLLAGLLTFHFSPILRASTNIC